jgi:phosphate uptake regulator
MLRELLRIFGSSDPLREMGDNFGRMLDLTREANLSAARIFFGESVGSAGAERAMLHERDAQVNALEQTIRRQVILHLSLPGNEADVPYSLLLISLVKDVERLGDYAKNLSEIVDIRPEPLPAGPLLDDLRGVRDGVEKMFSAVAEVFRDAALVLIRDGRALARRCDRLVTRVGRGDCDAGTTAALILATRYYKRIGGHLLNVLSSVVMPLDKVDYYDEDEAAADPGGAA